MRRQRATPEVERHGLVRGGLGSLYTSRNKDLNQEDARASWSSASKRGRVESTLDVEDSSIFGSDAGMNWAAELEDFLLSLPLGTDSQSAMVEQMVAEKVMELQASNAQLRSKLHEWARVAMELHSMVDSQHHQIQSLHEEAATQKASSQEHQLAIRDQLLPVVAAQAAAMTASMLTGSHHGNTSSLSQSGPPSTLTTPLATPGANHRAASTPKTEQLHSIQAAIKGIMAQQSGQGGHASKHIDPASQQGHWSTPEHFSNSITLHATGVQGVLPVQGSVKRRTHSPMPRPGLADGVVMVERGTEGGSALPSPLALHTFHAVTQDATGFTPDMQALAPLPLPSPASIAPPGSQAELLVAQLQQQLAETRAALVEQQLAGVRTADEVSRLRAALLDAEMDMQRISQSGTTAGDRASKAQEEAASLHTQLHAATAAQATAAQQIASLQAQLSDQQAQAVADVKQLRDQVSQLLAAQSDSAHLQKQLTETAAGKLALQQQLKEVQEELGRLRQQEGGLRAEVREGNALLASSQAECVSLHEQLTATDTAHLKLEGVSEELRAQLAVAVADGRQLRAEIREAHSAQTQLQEQHQELQVQLQAQHEQHQDMQVELYQLQEQHQELQAQHEQLQEQHQQLQTQHEQLQEQHQQLQAQHEQLQEQHQELQTQHEQHQEQHMLMRREHAQITSEYEQLWGQHEQRRVRMDALVDDLRSQLGAAQGRAAHAVGMQEGLVNELRASHSQLADLSAKAKLLDVLHPESEQQHLQLHVHNTAAAAEQGGVLGQQLAEALQQKQELALQLAGLYGQLDALMIERGQLHQQVAELKVTLCLSSEDGCVQGVQGRSPGARHTADQSVQVDGSSWDGLQRSEEVELRQLVSVAQAAAESASQQAAHWQDRYSAEAQRAADVALQLQTASRQLLQQEQSGTVLAGEELRVALEVQAQLRAALAAAHEQLVVMEGERDVEVAVVQHMEQQLLDSKVLVDTLMQELLTAQGEAAAGLADLLGQLTSLTGQQDVWRLEMNKELQEIRGLHAQCIAQNEELQFQVTQLRAALTLEQGMHAAQRAQLVQQLQDAQHAQHLEAQLVQQLRQQLTATEACLQGHEQQEHEAVVQLRQQLAETDRQLAVLQSVADKATAEREVAVSEQEEKTSDLWLMVKQLNAQCDVLTRQAALLETDRQEAAEKVSRLQADLSQQTTKLSVAEQRTQELEAALSQAAAATNLQQQHWTILEAELKSVAVSYNDSTVKVTQLQAQVEQLQQELVSTCAARDALAADAEQRQAALDDAGRQVHVLARALNVLQQDVIQHVETSDVIHRHQDSKVEADVGTGGHGAGAAGLEVLPVLSPPAPVLAVAGAQQQQEQQQCLAQRGQGQEEEEVEEVDCRGDESPHEQLVFVISTQPVTSSNNNNNNNSSDNSSDSPCHGQGHQGTVSIHQEGAFQQWQPRQPSYGYQYAGNGSNGSSSPFSLFSTPVHAARSSAATSPTRTSPRPTSQGQISPGRASYSSVSAGIRSNRRSTASPGPGHSRHTQPSPTLSVTLSSPSSFNNSPNTYTPLPSYTALHTATASTQLTAGRCSPSPLPQFLSVHHNPLADAAGAGEQGWGDLPVQLTGVFELGQQRRLTAATQPQLDSAEGAASPAAAHAASDDSASPEMRLTAGEQSKGLSVSPDGAAPAAAAAADDDDDGGDDAEGEEEEGEVMSPPAASVADSGSSNSGWVNTEMVPAADRAIAHAFDDAMRWDSTSQAGQSSDGPHQHCAGSTSSTVSGSGSGSGSGSARLLMPPMNRHASGDPMALGAGLPSRAADADAASQTRVAMDSITGWGAADEEVVGLGLGLRLGLAGVGMSVQQQDEQEEELQQQQRQTVAASQQVQQPGQGDTEPDFESIRQHWEELSAPYSTLDSILTTQMIPLPRLQSIERAQTQQQQQLVPQGDLMGWGPGTQHTDELDSEDGDDDGDDDEAQQQQGQQQGQQEQQGQAAGHHHMTTADDEGAGGSGVKRRLFIGSVSLTVSESESIGSPAQDLTHHASWSTDSQCSAQSNSQTVATAGNAAGPAHLQPQLQHQAESSTSSSSLPSRTHAAPLAGMAMAVTHHAAQDYTSPSLLATEPAAAALPPAGLQPSIQFGQAVDVPGRPAAQRPFSHGLLALAKASYAHSLDASTEPGARDVVTSTSVAAPGTATVAVTADSSTGKAVAMSAASDSDDDGAGGSEQRTASCSESPGSTIGTKPRGGTPLLIRLQRVQGRSWSRPRVKPRPVAVAAVASAGSGTAAQRDGQAAGAELLRAGAKQQDAFEQSYSDDFSSADDDKRTDGGLQGSKQAGAELLHGAATSSDEDKPQGAERLSTGRKAVESSKAAAQRQQAFWVSLDSSSDSD